MQTFWPGLSWLLKMSGRDKKKKFKKTTKCVLYGNILVVVEYTSFAWW
jgi:hypothetical protein